MNKEKTTIVDHLRGMQAEFEKLTQQNFPFNERELAKAELVRSLLKSVDTGRLLEYWTE